MSTNENPARNAHLPTLRISVFEDIAPPDIEKLLQHYSLSLELVSAQDEIPGSYWGTPEAGLIGSRLFVRHDTPLHSLLHEACHFICMPAERRDELHTDAGGDYEEENAVCYLQILLAEKIPGYGARLCMQDMDTWGYTFRLGSARAWFEQDAADAADWLKQHRLP